MKRRWSLFVLLVFVALLGASIYDAVPQGTFSVKAYGAIGNGIANDNTAVQAALTACEATGGIVWFPPGTYADLNLTLVMSAATIGCTLQGAGSTVSILSGLDASHDILTVGTNGLERADNIGVRDLGFTGGRYQIRLNNSLFFFGQRVVLSSGVTNIYGEGQNEHVRLDEINAASSTGPLGGIYFGATNGGTGSPAMDYPETQKDLWTHLRIAGAAGGPALNITAGILSSSQQVSGEIVIQQLNLESNHKDNVDLNWCSLGVQITQMTNEDSLDANNTYNTVLVDNLSTATIDGHSSISAQAGNKPKYFINAPSGQISFKDSVTGGAAAATSDLYLGYLAFIENVSLIGGTATGVTQAGSHTNNQVFINVTASDGATPIIPTHESVLTPNTNSGKSGFITGNLAYFVSGDANPQWEMSNNADALGHPGLNMGVGGSTAVDTQIYRDAAAHVHVTGALQGTLGVGSVAAHLATFGTCNSAHEGIYATQDDSAVACVVGITAAAGGTTHCGMYCNGALWLRTGL